MPSSSIASYWGEWLDSCAPALSVAHFGDENVGLLHSGIALNSFTRHSLTISVPPDYPYILPERDYTEISWHSWTAPGFFHFFSGASVVGVPVWRQSGLPVWSGLQANTWAAGKFVFCGFYQIYQPNFAFPDPVIVLGYGCEKKKNTRLRQDSNLESSDPKSDALSIRPRVRSQRYSLPGVLVEHPVVGIGGLVSPFLCRKSAVCLI